MLVSKATCIALQGTLSLNLTHDLGVASTNARLFEHQESLTN